MLTEDFLKENEIEIPAEKLELINTQVSSIVADKEKEFSETANTNAEKILSGAAAKVQELTGVQREQGQKIADYISTAGEKYLESERSKVQTKITELEEKIKNSKPDDLLKQQLEELKVKEENFTSVLNETKEGYETQIKELNSTLSVMKNDIAFNSVKPTFPDTVNTYEAEAKWKEFVAGVKEKYDIEVKDGVAMLKDKENEFKTMKLSELVKADKTLSELMKTRQQKGPKIIQSGNVLKIEGLPFDVLDTETSSEVQKKIADYLIKEKNLDKISQEYAKQYSELLQKWKQGTAKK